MAEAADVVLFGEPLILLGAAVLAVPIFKRLGLGSVLGYLAAGVVIGPIARLITGPEEIFRVAELGVVAIPPRRVLPAGPGILAALGILAVLAPAVAGLPGMGWALVGMGVVRKKS